MGAIYAMLLPGFGFAGLVVMEQRRRLKRALLGALGLALLLILCSCGGGGMASEKTSATNPANPAGTSATYLVSVDGVAGAIQNSTTVTLQIK